MQEVMGSLTPSGSQLGKDMSMFEVLELELSTANKWIIEMPSASVCFWLIKLSRLVPGKPALNKFIVVIECHYSTLVKNSCLHKATVAALSRLNLRRNML